VKISQALAAPSLGRILELRPGGQVLVAGLEDGSEESICEVLQTAAIPLPLCAGDRVIAIRPEASKGWVVLGRLPSTNLREKNSPQEILLEAGTELTLKVGESSITLRADGKILIKGKDLVSHAKRMNRIKGGAVSIN
jgi:hypothetical protein